MHFMRQSKLRTIALFLIFIFVIAVLPFSITMAPKRILKVVDSNKQPLNGVLVRQIWYQYSLHIHGEEEFITDYRGRVVLPERKVDTNLVVLLMGACKNIYKLSIHAGFGSHESIGFIANGYQTIFFHSAMKPPLESDIIVLKAAVEQEE
jgi:hypothetical protein